MLGIPKVIVETKTKSSKG